VESLSRNVYPINTTYPERFVVFTTENAMQYLAALVNAGADFSVSYSNTIQRHESRKPDHVDVWVIDSQGTSAQERGK
jgi:hypothetical protein